MNLSVCIDMMYTYCDFYKRFLEVKTSGIDTVEFWKWSNKDIERIYQIIQEKKMQISIFNIDSLDEKLSYDLSRGIINDGRVDEFLQALEESIPVYKKLNAKGMIVLIGENKPYYEINVLKCLEAAKPVLEMENVNLVVEPLNTRDRIGYSMPYAKPILKLIKELNSPHIKMLYDIYHQNMTGDFDLDEVCEHLEQIGHFHVADVPGRHEPGSGNVDYMGILQKINSLSFGGYIGLEYGATKQDGETLGFFKEVGYGF